MKKIYALSLIFSMIVAGMGMTAYAQPSAEEIVDKANHMAYYQGKSGRAKVNMTITDSQDRTRNREFTILRLDMSEEKDKEQKFYVYFHQPADVRKMVFMVWKHIGKDDDRWLYLPDLDLVKRIAATDKRTSFVGSTFYYEDVSGRQTDLDKHELLETTDTYYVLKSVPKNPDNVEFAYYKNWIHKDTFIPIKTSYFDRDDNEYRTYQALKVEEIDGLKTVTQSQMKDLRSGSTTVNEYSSVEYNIDLPEDIFTERYLRRAPRQHLR
ncbi:outer membrane lipoprotein-sorting protein [bacterium]|nr:outer membrane lipoprotein-sorting protein [bacterium]